MLPTRSHTNPVPRHKVSLLELYQLTVKLRAPVRSAPSVDTRPPLNNARTGEHRRHGHRGSSGCSSCRPLQHFRRRRLRARPMVPLEQVHTKRLVRPHTRSAGKLSKTHIAPACSCSQQCSPPGCAECGSKSKPHARQGACKRCTNSYKGGGTPDCAKCPEGAHCVPGMGCAAPDIACAYLVQGKSAGDVARNSPFTGRLTPTSTGKTWMSLAAAACALLATVV